MTLDEAIKEVSALRDVLGSGHEVVTGGDRTDEALGMVLDAATKYGRLRPACPDRHGGGFCTACSEWYCLACGDRVPPGFGTHCDRCRANPDNLDA